MFSVSFRYYRLDPDVFSPKEWKLQEGNHIGNRILQFLCAPYNAAPIWRGLRKVCKPCYQISVAHGQYHYTCENYHNYDAEGGRMSRHPCMWFLRAGMCGCKVYLEGRCFGVAVITISSPVSLLTAEPLKGSTSCEATLWCDSIRGRHHECVAHM